MADIHPGYKTFVKYQNPSEPNSDNTGPSSVLPGDTHTRAIDNISLSYNKPDPDRDQYRTKPRDKRPYRKHPDHGWQPYPSKTPKSAYGDQEKYKGRLEVYHKRYYTRNKKKIKTRSERYYIKNKKKPIFKKKKQLYRDYPIRYKRNPNGPNSFKERDMNKEARQHKQHGQDKIEAHRYYLKHRNQIKRKVEKRYNHVKRTPQFKRLQHLRVLHPDRFKRLTASIVSQGGPCFYGKGSFVQVWDVNQEMSVFLNDGSVFNWVDFLRSYIPLSAKSLDVFFEMTDFAFDSIKCASIRTVDEDAKVDVDRASQREPSDVYGEDTTLYYTVFDNPGSSKVIPENRDFVNKKAFTLKELDAKYSNKRVTSNSVRLVKDIGGLKEYRVQGKTGSYKVMIDTKSENAKVSCTCPDWVYSGSEYRAYKQGYLYGKARGTLEPPQNHKKNFLCKHIHSCLVKELS